MAIGVVDIGGTKIAIGLANPSGNLLAQTSWSTHPNKGPTAGIAQIVSELALLAMKNSVTIQGIGIGCTGPIDPFTSELGPNTFLPGWEGAVLCPPLEKYFQVPVFAENDADAAALGEYYWGAGKDTARFIYITVSTGIGGGLVLDGKLYRGAGNSHPEMGHQVLDPQGPVCTCGARGCWEAFASGPAMAAWYASQALAKGQTQAPLTAKEICMQAGAGDHLAIQTIDREGFYLGLGMANLVSLFMPDCIAMGGGVMQSHQLFFERIQKCVQANCNMVPHHLVRVQTVAHRLEAGLIGAAAVFISRSEEVR